MRRRRGGFKESHVNFDAKQELYTRRKLRPARLSVECITSFSASLFLSRCIFTVPVAASPQCWVTSSYVVRSAVLWRIVLDGELLARLPPVRPLTLRTCKGTKPELISSSVGPGHRS